MVLLLHANQLGFVMRDLLWISPPDGIPSGETEERFTPLTGLFAIRTARGGLERALSVQDIEGRWHVHLDGFLITKPHPQWVEASGYLGKWNCVLGRRLTGEEYARLVKVRLSDKERGIDLSAAIDLNSVEIPSF